MCEDSGNAVEVLQSEVMDFSPRVDVNNLESESVLQPVEPETGRYWVS